MARRTVVVRRGSAPLSPASRQLLQRVRQRQALRSAMVLLGLLGCVLATALSLTVRKRIVWRRLEGVMMESGLQQQVAVTDETVVPLQSSSTRRSTKSSKPEQLETLSTTKTTTTSLRGKAKSQDLLVSVTNTTTTAFNTTRAATQVSQA